MHKVITIGVLGWFLLPMLAGAYDIEVNVYVKDVEEKILSEMKEKKMKDDQFFSTYIKAAEEAVKFSREIEAIYFYDKALKYKTKKDKFFIYKQMMALSVFSGHKELGKEIFVDYQKEYGKKKRSHRHQEELYMYKVLLTNKLHSEVLKKDEIKIMMKGGQIPRAIFQHDVQIYLERKDFKQVYDLYKGEQIKQARIDEQIIYDLTGVLSKKSEKNLLCEAQYNKYPQARQSSYSMTICGMLLDVKKGQKPKKEDLTRLNNILKNFPSKNYLGKIAKNLY